MKHELGGYIEIETEIELDKSIYIKFGIYVVPRKSSIRLIKHGRCTTLQSNPLALQENIGRFDHYGYMKLYKMLNLQSLAMYLATCRASPSQ